MRRNNIQNSFYYFMVVLSNYFEKILPKCEVRESIEDDIFYAMGEPIDMIVFQESNNQKLIENETQEPLL